MKTCPYRLFQVAEQDETLYDLDDMCHPTLLSETCSPHSPDTTADLDPSFNDQDVSFWQMMIDVGTCEIVPRGTPPQSEYNVEMKVNQKLLNVIPFLDLTSFNTRTLSFDMG